MADGSAAFALPRVCVIGAGSSGIATCKQLHEAGIPFDCFEASDRVGGNWVFQNTNGMSSAYRSLHINTSRDKMAYSDFPMPANYPDYPHHSHIATYFDAYVDHFGFRDRIYAMPDPATMARERDEMHQAVKSHYVASARHTIQINCGEYAFDLRKELKRGIKRAKAAGNRLPIPSRAAKVLPLAAE